MSELIIDCDIHPSATAADPIENYLEPQFREAVRMGLAASPGNGYSNPFGVDRRDAQCNDPAATARDHLDRYDITYGVLQSPGLKASVVNQLDVGTAIARAWNEWQVSWLAADKRYLGSVCVNMNEPEKAAAEIRRVVARGDRVVQLCISGEQRDLLGHRRYWPVYAAAQECGLAVTVHPGQEGSLNSVTPVGRPSTYFEWHTVIPLTYQGHAVSLVCEGVFEQFPKLKFVLCEGGIFWILHTMMRMDKNYKALRATTPWVKRLPSEYILDHVRLTTQPIEEPANPNDLLDLLRMVRAEKTVCFATDFPHWDFDDPARVFPRKIDPALKARILYDNAAETFRLPARSTIESKQTEVASV